MYAQTAAVMVMSLAQSCQIRFPIVRTKERADDEEKARGCSNEEQALLHSEASDEGVGRESAKKDWRMENERRNERSSGRWKVKESGRAKGKKVVA